MIVLHDQGRTIGEVLPTISSPMWQRELLASRMKEEFWRGFWLAVWAGICVGGWGGWLAAQVRAACP